MYTSDIDWSPSVKLGHNEVDENKLQEAHERALRPNAIKSVKKLLSKNKRRKKSLKD